MASRPRLWWNTIQWEQAQETISTQTPWQLTWEKHPPYDRLHNPIAADLQPNIHVKGWETPNILAQGGLFHCLTTQANTDEGRPPPQHTDVDQATWGRWEQGKKQFPPWQYRPQYLTREHQAEWQPITPLQRERLQQLVWGHDHDGAYRQLPLEDPEIAYVLLQTPHGPTLWHHHVLLFGSAASVWAYNRFGDVLTHISRCLCGIPVVHYVDDYGSINTEQDAQSSFHTFAQLNSILGFHMKPSKEQRPANEHKIQGVIIQCQTNQISVKPCPHRIQRLLQELHNHLHAHRQHVTRRSPQTRGEMLFHYYSPIRTSRTCPTQSLI